MTKLMDEKEISYVQNAIDLIIGSTGYPVLGSTLTENSVATRQQLRYLAAKGRIKELSVEVPSADNSLIRQSTTFKAYYTERVVPEHIKELLESI